MGQLSSRARWCGGRVHRLMNTCRGDGHACRMQADAGGSVDWCASRKSGTSTRCQVVNHNGVASPYSKDLTISLNHLRALIKRLPCSLLANPAFMQHQATASCQLTRQLSPVRVTSNTVIRHAITLGCSSMMDIHRCRSRKEIHFG